MAERTHSVTVDGVGHFVFRRRSFGLQIAIESRADRITDGPVHTKEIRQAALMLATLDVLTAHAPEGWDLETADPLDEDTFTDVSKVFARLRAAEDEFRAGAKAERPSMGLAA